MANRPESIRVLSLLERLDASLLAEARCWFGGGTAVSLRCGELRLSRDVDFLCASREGYRLLRRRVFDKGARGLFVTDVTIAREARVDRYGIRTAVMIEGEPVKLEIVSEGRIDLTGVVDSTLPVQRLADVDLVSETLLANEDRYLDDAALGRDAIDLVMLERTLGGLPSEAWEKAQQAYGPSVEVAWARSLLRLRRDPNRLARWLDLMDVLPSARDLLAARLAELPDTEEDER